MRLATLDPGRMWGVPREPLSDLRPRAAAGGRAASYFRITGVEGEPVLGGGTVRP